jgi:hypothetical protein
MTVADHDAVVRPDFAGATVAGTGGREAITAGCGGEQHHGREQPESGSMRLRLGRDRQELLKGLSAVKEFAVRHQERAAQIVRSAAPGTWSARTNAAAAVVRIPNLLSGVSRLLEAELVFEADSLVRVLMELAITALWVGRDEQRAGLVREDALYSQLKGLRRIQELQAEVGEHGVAFELPSIASQMLEDLERRKPPPRKLPDLASRAAQVMDEPDEAVDSELAQAINTLGIQSAPAPGSSLAKVMYRAYYDFLSSSSHGDPRTAILLVHGAAGESYMWLTVLAKMAALSILIAAQPTLPIPQAEFAPIVEAMAQDFEAIGAPDT